MTSTLKVLLIAVSVFACYAQELLLSSWHPEPGDPAPITFRVDQPFILDQAKVFGGTRNRALSEYVPLYLFSPDRADFGSKQLHDLIGMLSAPNRGEELDAKTLVKVIKKACGLELTREAAAMLLAYPALQRLLEGMLPIENTIAQGKIVEETGPLKDKGTAEVRYPDPVGTVTYPAREFLTLEKARELLRKQAEQVFWQVDKQVLGQVTAIASALLQPNLKYDHKENDRRIEEIMRRYPSKVIHYDPGRVLVPARKTLTEEDTLLLAATLEAEREGFPESIVGVVLSIIVFTVLYNLVLAQTADLERHRTFSFPVHLSILILTVLLFKAFLLLTPFPVRVLPIGLIPIVLVFLNQGRFASAWTTVLGAVLTAFVSGRSSEGLIYFIAGALTTFLASGRAVRRSQVFLPCVAAGAVCGMLVACFGVDWHSFTSAFPYVRTDSPGSPLAVPGLELLKDAGWAVCGGLLAGPAALGILPMLELALGAAPTYKISTWTNLEHPLLKELLNRAPGTYQHTMSVASLSQSAGEAIGANVPLLRAGVYFHDIGKMKNPQYFVENQAGNSNPHDSLGALESAGIIMDHVRTGVFMGRKAGLPRVILDFIPQHHGTQVLEYFWNKAKQAEPGSEIAEENFRYEGPKPQSREAAVLMIVDAVEAASRTLSERTRETVDALVRHVVETRIDDGQFDECRITTEDLAHVRASLVDSLAAAFHNRIEYPWQEDLEERKP